MCKIQVFDFNSLHLNNWRPKFKA